MRKQFMHALKSRGFRKKWHDKLRAILKFKEVGTLGGILWRMPNPVSILP